MDDQFLGSVPSQAVPRFRCRFGASRRPFSPLRRLCRTAWPAPAARFRTGIRRRVTHGRATSASMPGQAGHRLGVRHQYLGRRHPSWPSARRPRLRPPGHPQREWPPSRRASPRRRARVRYHGVPGRQLLGPARLRARPRPTRRPRRRARRRRLPVEGGSSARLAAPPPRHPSRVPAD